jgi:hypothetical protein
MPMNVDLKHCASCRETTRLSRWMEHDFRDQPEPRCVVLCWLCSNKLIEPHPRLYKKLADNEPFPGGDADLYRVQVAGKATMQVTAS